MKKISAILFLAVVTSVTFAQAPLSPEFGDIFHSGQVKEIKPVSKADVSNLRSEDANGSRDLAYYWVNYSDAIDYEYNGGTFMNFAALPLWPDSTVYIVAGTGDPADDFYWYAHGYSHCFDPISQLIIDYVDQQYSVIGGASSWFNADHGFHIDSLRFYYFYDRPNTGYTDTLKVYVMAPGSSAFVTGNYLDEDGSGTYDEGTDISLFLTKYDYTKNRPSPSSAYTEYTFLLGDADTASFDLADMAIPLNFFINKNSPNHTVGVAFQFIPGQPYSLGDTLLDFSDPPLYIANPLNRFWLLTYEEILNSAPISWSEYSNNQDGLASSEVRYNNSSGGWNGFYVSTYAYTDAFAFEHGYVDWYVAPEGANFVATDLSPCVSLTKQFTDLSNFTTGSAVYYWDFGGVGSSLDQNPVYTFPGPGTYAVTESVSQGSTTYEQTKNVTVDYCLGVNTLESLQSFTMYPNPTQDVLHMNLNFSTPQDVMISVLNTAGQEVYSEYAGFTSNYSTDINTSNLPAGVYLARIASGNKVSTKTFVVNH